MNPALKPIAALSALFITAAAPVMALEVTRVETASALVKCQPANYATNMNGSVYTALNPGNRAGYSLGGILLWRFDVAAYTGMVLLGNADLSFGLTYSEVTPRLFHYYAGLSNWDEAVVTWQNWLGPTTTNINNRAWTNWFGPEIASGNVGNSDLSTIYHVSIPSNLVQRWISDPLSNIGIGVIPTNYGPFSFATRSYTNFVNRCPTLTMNFQSSNIKPLMPTNLTPANAVIAQPLVSIGLSASAFSDPNGNGHSNTQWQVSTDPAFSATAWDSGPGPAGTAATVAVTLQYQTRYYWRVRYRDNDPLAPEWSDWSAPTYFDTTLNLIAPVIVREGQSCMIRPGANADTNYSTGSFYNPVNPVTNVCPAGAVMYWFDLRVFSQYTGLLVTADATLAIPNTWTQTANPPNFDARAVLAPWQESTATWNNFIGPSWSAWPDKFGPVLDTKSISQMNTTNYWTIDKQVIQYWLDNPGSNAGFALVPWQATGNAQLNNRRAPAAPWLAFDLVSSGATAPTTPTNVAPASGAVNQGLAPMLSATPFAGAGLTHGASQWQIATDPAFVGLLWDSGALTGSLVAAIVPSNTLQYSSRYYWHVRYISTEGGKSGYSPATSFDTTVIAGEFTKDASANAMIKYTLPASNWNGQTTAVFLPHGASNGVHGGIILAQFDLSVFQGFSVLSDATFAVTWGWVNTNFNVITFTPYLVLAPWHETGVTWNTFVGVDDTNFWAELGPGFGSAPAINDGTTTWSIAQAVVQAWLDNASSNMGLALVADTVNANAFFNSRKTPAKGPKLTMNIVPEPLAGMIAVLALAGALRRRAG